MVFGIVAFFVDNPQHTIKVSRCVDGHTLFGLPDYNDFVEYDGHVYGFDGSIFACIDLTTGKRLWKKDRYGNGQVLLLPDAGQMLVVSETGELVLLKADPKKHVEIAKIPAIEGKTWNHPVLVDHRLYIRNGEEAACYELVL